MSGENKGAIHICLIYHDLNETYRVLSGNSNCLGIYGDATIMSCGCEKQNLIPQKSVFSIRHGKRFAVGMSGSIAPPFQMAIKCTHGEPLNSNNVNRRKTHTGEDRGEERE